MSQSRPSLGPDSRLPMVRKDVGARSPSWLGARIGIAGRREGIGLAIDQLETRTMLSVSTIVGPMPSPQASLECAAPAGLRRGACRS